MEVKDVPKKLDSCVKKLIKEGYSEDEAWAICRKKLKYKLQMEYEQRKKILTGQLVDKKFLNTKEKEFTSKEEV